ncbi:hypothetical protein H0E84_05755 [Luteimonas sp. SJ-92]|uniref:Uncharacterized protein n=1 Tax=Luteimonas salinisoli TaxID=2752307 RepID=A0A853JAT3_9GAMM|nr:hypothetical protein [Luteimonas salinisoli]
MAVALLSFPVLAQDEAPKRIPVDALERMIVTQTPQTRVETIDHERLAVRRIDIVDEEGTIRMSLAAPAEQPIIDGIQYRRIFPASGLTVFDRNGSERGGFAVADLEDGGTATVVAQDHVNGDAIGWRVMPDGSVGFHLNQRAPVLREPALGNHIVPGIGGATRISLSVAADGTPAIALADAKDRPRLRLTVTEQGYGAIEFLDAEGDIVETLAPEARQAGER